MTQQGSELALGSRPNADDLDMWNTYAALSGSMFGKSVGPATYHGLELRRCIREDPRERVYDAYDPNNKRAVTLRVVEGHDPRLVEGAQSLTEVEHPNLVRFLEAGVHENSLYIVSERVAGEDLRAQTHESGSSMANSMRLYREVARGIEQLHRLGLIHGPFRPDDVYVDSQGHARVRQFTVPHATKPSTDGPLTSTARPDRGHVRDTRMVTPKRSQAHKRRRSSPYWAPEEVLGGRVDARSDQFGLCAALFEVLIGFRPMPGILQRKMRATSAAPRLPRRVRHTLARGLSLDPRDRFDSMEQLLAGLGK